MSPSFVPTSLNPLGDDFVIFLCRFPVRFKGLFISYDSNATHSHIIFISFSEGNEALATQSLRSTISKALMKVVDHQLPTSSTQLPPLNTQLPTLSTQLPTLNAQLTTPTSISMALIGDDIHGYRPRRIAHILIEEAIETLLQVCLSNWIASFHFF